MTGGSTVGREQKKPRLEQPSLGRARFPLCVDFVSRPLDFECYRRAFKIQFSGVDFEIDESGGIGARLRLYGDA